MPLMAPFRTETLLMTRPRLLLLLTCLALIGLLRPTATTAAPPPAAEESAPALWELMEQMGEHLRDAKQALQRPDGQPEAADLAQKMQALAIACKAMTPPKLQAMPEGEKRDELLLAYRQAMIGLTRQLLDFEAAVLAGEKDRAFELIDQLVEARFKGHIKFKSD